MPRQDVKVTTPDGTCSAVVVTPDGAGPWPPVIMYMDAGGVRPAMIQMAEQLAGMGYVAFLPDMYYRHGDYEPFDFASVFTDEKERNRLFAMIRSITPEMVTTDAGAFLDYLSSLPSAAADKVGATGYCMGGKMSLWSAEHYPDRVVAAASFHGGALVSESPDSPHRLVDKIAGRVYVAGAINDDSYTAKDAEVLEAALTDAGVDHTCEMYQALHGFSVPDNPTFDEDAAARHWRALEALYAAKLH